MMTKWIRMMATRCRGKPEQSLGDRIGPLIVLKNVSLLDRRLRDLTYILHDGNTSWKLEVVVVEVGFYLLMRVRCVYYYSMPSLA